MTYSDDAVVVTGVGATTPLGGTAESSWQRLLAGESGITAITADWAHDLPVKIAGVAATEPADPDRRRGPAAGAASRRATGRTQSGGGGGAG